MPRRRRSREFHLASPPLHAEAWRTEDTALIVIDQPSVESAPVLRHGPLVTDRGDATRGVREARGKVVKV